MCIERYSRSRDAAKKLWTGANLGKGVYPRLWQTEDITTSRLVLRTDLRRCQVFGLEQINAQFHREIPQLRADSQQLRGQIARLRRDSSHSSKPPSSDIVSRRITRHPGGNANARSVVRRAIPGMNESPSLQTTLVQPFPMGCPPNRRNGCSLWTSGRCCNKSMSSTSPTSLPNIASESISIHESGVS